MKNANIKKDIAIVGMSGIFSQSEDIAAFWKHLINGKELVKTYTHDELRGLEIDEKLIKDPNYILSNSLIKDPENFDYAFFGYTKDEAKIMDPQIRLMHEHIWLTLEDAGCNPEAYDGKIGLYLAASDNLNWRTHTFINPNNHVSDFMAARLANKTFISTLISYNLNLKGPSFYSDTACSSSLTAMHFACRGLLMKECSLALTGASSIITTKDKGYWYDQGMVFSKDGHCRAFDKDSSGTFFGEGVGVIALKRLEDALQDKDHIYAVIKSTAVNNDGKRKVGYTAPSVLGQAECIKLAHRIAGVEPETIGYIEAHGTGTKLGDPIEIEALNKAFDYNINHRCAIGSVKSNLGHLDAVAGIVGVIKTSLSLKNRLLPPSINYTSPNPEINFASGPFYVNDTLQKWERKNDQPLRAGVSSFGIGGTNAHAILEEEPERSVATPEEKCLLLVFSARTKTSLSSYQEKLRNFIRESKQEEIRSIAYTLQIGRKHFRNRSFLVCKTKDGAYEALEDMMKKPLPNSNSEAKNTVFMFSGGGSQYYKMALQLYFHEPYFKEIMDYGFQVLKGKTEKDFKKIIGYGEENNTDETLINSIDNMLPVLFLVEYAVARLLMNIGVHPNYMIGHSLGEYVAACISGVFSFEDALEMVIKRGELTARLPEGGMVGVELSAEKVQAYLTDKLSIAAINMENSCVISGAKGDIQNFIKVLEEKNIDYTKLKISIAAHSLLLDEILDEYSNALDSIQLSPPKIPFISNLSGKEVTEEEATSTRYWVAHLRNTVHFLKGITHLLEKGNGNYIEIGSGGVLTSFLKQNRNFNKNNFGINVLRHPKEVYNDHEYFLQSLGKLWQNGLSVDWSAFNNHEKYDKIPVPGYAFDKTYLEVKVDPFQQLVNEGLLLHSNRTKVKDALYVASWKKCIPVIDNRRSQIPGCYLIFSDGNSMMAEIASELSTAASVIEIRKGSDYKATPHFVTINPFRQDHYEMLFKDLDDKGIEVSQVIYNWNFQVSEDILKPCIPLIHLNQNLIIHQLPFLKKITFISLLASHVLGNERIDVAQNLAKKTQGMIIKNNSAIFSSFLDVDTYEPKSLRDKRILNDIKYNFTVENIAYRNNQRWMGFFEKIQVETTQTPDILKGETNYLIINGLERIGNVLLAHLCNKYDSKFIVTGNKEWSQGKGASLNEAFEGIAQLQNAGKDVHYCQVDSAKTDDVRKLMRDVERKHGAIAGVIFIGAENELSDLSDLNKLVEIQTRKIQSIQNVYNIFKNKALDFVWIPLKLSSVMHYLNESIYADTYAKVFLEVKHDKLRNWTMVSLDDLHKETISDSEISEIFELSVNNGLASAIVSFKDINKLEKTLQAEKKEKHNSNDLEIQSNENYVPPETKLEKELCELWQPFLGMDKLGVNDNFFESGGNSLKAMTILKRIAKQYDVQISLKDFFAKPTIQLLSEEISIGALIKADSTRKERKTIRI